MRFRHLKIKREMANNMAAQVSFSFTSRRIEMASGPNE
jgi:hypothetical protein